MWQIDGLIHVLATRGQPAVDAEQARRGPRDLVQQRVRLRRPRRRLHPVEHPDAAEAQPVLAGDRARRVGRADRAADRIPRGGQEPVGAQRQPDLRLRRGAAGAGPVDPGHPADDRRGAHPAGQRRPDGGGARRRLHPGHRPERVHRRRPAASTTAAPTSWSAGPCARPAGAGIPGRHITGAMLDEAARRRDRAVLGPGRRRT